MELSTLKTGTCPVCGSKEVYTDKGQTKRGERMVLIVTGWKSYFLDTYICCNCSHFEEHIPEKEFKNPKILEKIKANWKKVK
jgi:hypothetical protein